MSAAISHTTVDSLDAYAQSVFWGDVLGFHEDPDDPNRPGDDECMIVSADGAQRLLFLELPDAKQLKNRVHLDLKPTDCTRDEELERLLTLGATQLADFREPDGAGWVVLSYPEGNEFCILRSDAERQVSWETCLRLHYTRLMVTIIANPDCGNSPRMQILRDVVVAVAERDHEHIGAVLADEFSWTLIGDRTIRDRDVLQAWLTAFPSVDAVEFGTLVNHGRGASVDGVFDVADGSRQAFSFVLCFSSTTKTAKVVGVNCYLIPQPANG